MNPEKEPFITIGMLTRNRAWCLARVLESIERAEYPKERLKLVFVDDHSTDGTWEILEQWMDQHGPRYSDVVLLNEHSNIPEARNICLKRSEGTYILFWDSDVIPPSEDLLNQLVETMEDNQDVGAIGCSYIYENPSLLTRAKKTPTSTYTHAVFLGFTLVRLESLRKIGGFNEEMIVGEDTEVFIRMKGDTGSRIMWGPCPVLHLREPGAQTSSPHGFRRWLRFAYRERAKGYFAVFGDLPLFLRMRIVYYFTLPLLWMSVLVLFLAGVMNPIFALLIALLSLLPALASAIHNSGFRYGLLTAMTSYLPMGIALSYGVFREALRASFHPNRRREKHNAS